VCDSKKLRSVMPSDIIDIFDVYFGLCHKKILKTVSINRRPKWKWIEFTRIQIISVFGVVTKHEMI
jgi:hypothetical protein